jgi:hypothetical protein
LPLDYDSQDVAPRRLEALYASREIPKQTGFHFDAFLKQTLSQMGGKEGFEVQRSKTTG